MQYRLRYKRSLTVVRDMNTFSCEFCEDGDVFLFMGRADDNNQIVLKKKDTIFLVPAYTLKCDFDLVPEISKDAEWA